MKRILPILLLTTALPVSAWGMDNFQIEENKISHESKTQKYKLNEKEQELIQQIFTLAQSDQCKEIKFLLNTEKKWLNTCPLGDSLKVWASMYNVHNYEIPEEQWFSLLDAGVKQTDSSYLQALYYDTMAFCYINQEGDVTYYIDKEGELRNSEGKLTDLLKRRKNPEVRPMSSEDRERNALQYWKKAAALGSAESSYWLGRYQIRDAEQQRDHTRFVKDVWETIEEVDVKLSREEYRKKIEARFEAIAHEDEVLKKIAEIDKNLPSKKYRKKIITLFKNIKIFKDLANGNDLLKHDLLKKIEEIDKKLSPEDYKNEVITLFEDKTYFMKEEQEVSKKVWEAILKIDINTPNIDYKKKVKKEFERISETGKALGKQIRKTITDILKRPDTGEKEHAANIIQTAVQNAKDDNPSTIINSTHVKNQLKQKPEKQQKEDTLAIESVFGNIMEEIAKTLLQNYGQGINHILRAAKLGYPPAIDSLKSSPKLTSLLEDYYDSINNWAVANQIIEQFNEIINQAKDKYKDIEKKYKEIAIKKKWSEEKTERKIEEIKGIKRNSEFFSLLFKHGLKEESAIRDFIINYRQEKMSTFSRIFYTLSEDYQNSTAKDILSYEVETTSGLKDRYKTHTNYDTCISAGNFLLRSNITEIKFKLNDNFGKQENTVNIKEHLAHAYYGKATILAQKGDEEAEQYGLKAIELGSKEAWNFLCNLANAYVEGNYYNNNSTKKFQRIPQKALSFYMMLMEHSPENLSKALEGVGKCIDFILNQTNASQYVYEDDIMILKNHQKIINSKFTQNRHSELNKKLSELNNKFTQLEGWANFNTAYKLTLSENKKQDLVKAQELFEKLLQGPEISKAHTEKAKRLLNALKNRREEYRKFIEEAKKEFKVVELPLTMDKFTLSAQVVGGVIKALNKHTVYGGWQGRGLGRESVFAFNPENKGEIDILFEVFQEKLMTEDLALEVRKCLFPRKGDDPEESDSDSDD